MQPLDALDFVDLSVFMDDFPIRIDLVYAQKNHPRNIFGEQIYHDKAKCWAHKDIACVALLASHRFYDSHGYFFSIKDSLRTIDAQQRMQETEIVKRNPHWCEEPNRLLSPPGKGGHPRGMAIDITLQDDNGQEIDMGTPFDYLSENPDHNPAARDYQDLPAAVLKRRKDMEDVLMRAAADLNVDFMPLASEWWDYRAPAAVYNKYAPLGDKELPDDMKMVNVPNTSETVNRNKTLAEVSSRLAPFIK